VNDNDARSLQVFDFVQVKTSWNYVYEMVCPNHVIFASHGASLTLIATMTFFRGVESAGRVECRTPNHIIMCGGNGFLVGPRVFMPCGTAPCRYGTPRCVLLLEAGHRRGRSKQRRQFEAWSHRHDESFWSHSV
jgi:hypothetical protein